MEKKEFRFHNFETLRGGQKGNGVKVQAKISNDGALFLAMYKQNGMTQDGRNPIFDHNNGAVSAISELEAAKVVRLIEKTFMSDTITKALNAPSAPLNEEVVLQHMNAKVPKTIKFILKEYNGAIQLGVSISIQNGDQFAIYLNEAEMEYFKEYLKASYSPIMKQILVEATDDRNFKKFAAEAISGAN